MKSAPYLSHFTPSAYDPYNNISFVELNKAKRGEYDRPVEDRVYNRQYKPPTAKIYIRRNGQANAKPKPFIWRIWRVQKMDDIRYEIASHLDAATDGAVLYDSRGHVIDHPDDIIEGNTYVLGHHEAFDGHLIEAANGQSSNNTRYSHDLPSHSAPHPNYASHAVPSHNYTSQYAGRSTAANRAYQKKRKDSMPRPETSFTFGERSEIYSLVDQGGYDPPTVASPRNSDFGNYHMYRKSENDDGYEETPWADLDEMTLKDRQMLQKHKEKHQHGIRRSRSDVIYNRRDQTNPGAYIIYAFLNGQGLNCQHVSFSRIQIEKGMPFILELVARRFNVKPSKLVNMDGGKIHDVTDLMSRGAYVLIPVGQSFRDTWYFLPDNAIDTSSDSERIKLRSAQRDRYVQKQDAKKYKQEKMRQTTAANRQIHGIYPRGYSLERNQQYRR